jgi:alginate O-acetyltransferase complex protein AlgI
MVFNSFSFLVFFILFFLVYWYINNKFTTTARNIFIIISSYIFYGWWDWRFLGLIVVSSIADYTIGIYMSRWSKQHSRKLLLVLSLIINLGILGFFKYFNFFIDSLNSLLDLFSIHISTTTLKIILPVGISFYTFQTLSYTIDLYKKKIEPTRDIFSFFAFVSFFPQLVAGPIERASRLLPQFYTKKTFNYKLSIVGLRLVLWGFFKKVVIADNFGVLANSLFNMELADSGLAVLAGSVFFALQIYADFSGYSDIAIGISKMLGFDLMRNFQTPYFATSFKNFWQRWHISLSSWFRDYVYIPLGGNKKSNWRVHFNIFLTFVLSGLWHGANSTFIIWGALHGLVLVLEKQFNLISLKRLYPPLVVLLAILFWIPFRAENYQHLAEMTASLLSFNSYTLLHLQQTVLDFSNTRFFVLIGITVLFLLVEYRLRAKDFSEWIGGHKKAFRISIYYLVILAILFLGNFSVKPSFIYFQF